MKRMLLTMKGHFLPYLSAAIPVRVINNWSTEEQLARSGFFDPAWRRGVSRQVVNHFRPCRVRWDANVPKSALPTLRNMSTNVIPHVICSLLLSNCFPNCSTVKLTVKKSKASQVQPKNPTRKNSHCCVLSMASSLNGLGARFIGGLREGRRVAMYRPGLMCS